MANRGVLVVLRGNSGSGKSTVATAVQQRLPEGRCTVISQDYIRREVLRERDRPGALTIDLIATVARQCLQRGLVVLVEGILNNGVYQVMLAELAATAADAHFFAWDLAWEETVRRHALRPKSEDFTPEEMREWYHGWQPLDFMAETRIDSSVTIEQAVERVLAAVGATDGNR